MTREFMQMKCFSPPEIVTAALEDGVIGYEKMVNTLEERVNDFCMTPEIEIIEIQFQLTQLDLPTFCVVYKIKES